MTSSSEEELRARVGVSAGQDANWYDFGAIDDQLRTLEQDLQRVRVHPLIPGDVAVGTFLYDVDTGLLDQID
jgi:carbonic anhydrase